MGGEGMGREEEGGREERGRGEELEPPSNRSGYGPGGASFLCES